MAIPKAEELLQEARASRFAKAPKSILAWWLLGTIGLFSIIFAGKIFETNNAGWYAIKQAAGTGTMTAFTKPGMFIQGFGDVTDYKASDIIYFSKHDNEGAKGDDSISVRFNDGATAQVSGNVRIELPADPAKLVEIHKKFRSYDALIKDTVRQVVAESVILTSALMSAEESYTTKRAEFSQMADDQVKNGVYLTEAQSVEKKDPKTGEITVKQFVNIQKDAKGNVMRKDPVLAQYGIRVTQFVIKDIDYQEEVHKTINSKQDALMKTVQARAEAEKAVQDRLTAEEVGKKNVAVAKYEQEVKKATAVTQAEQELEVSRLNKVAAEQNKQIMILKAEGEAEYRRKIMVADGALEKKLAAYVETQKVWADAMSKMTQPIVPQIMTGGSNGASVGTNGVQTFMEIMGLKAAKDLAVDTHASKH